MNQAANLVKMANQIGEFYESMQDRAEGIKSTFNHIRRSWDPRMRMALLEHIDHGAEGLDPFVLEAITTYRKEFTPAGRAGVPR